MNELKKIYARPRWVRPAAAGWALASLLSLGFGLTSGCGGDDDESCAGCGSGGSGAGVSDSGTEGSAGGGGASDAGLDSGADTSIVVDGGGAFPDGNIYVAGSRNAKVYEFDSNLNPVSDWTHPAFGTVMPAPGQPFGDGPAGMVFDAKGRLVVAGVDQFCIFSKPGVVVECHPKTKSQPTENVIFDLAGNLYTTTATGGTDEIHKYDANYTYITTFKMPTGNLTGVTCDPDGNLYIGSQLGGGAGSAIYKVDKVTLQPLDTLNIAGNVEGLQFAADGNILAAVGSGVGVVRITPKSPTTVISTITDPGLFFAVPLTIDNTGLIYTADYENGSGTALADLFVFDSTGAVKASKLPSEIYGPFGMVVAGAVLPCGAYQPR